MIIDLGNQVIDITAKKVSQLQSVDKSNLVNTSLLYIVGKDEHQKLKSYKLDLNETDESKMILPTKEYLDRRIAELGLNDVVLVYGLQQIQGQKTFTQYPFCIDDNNLDEDIYDNALIPKRYVIELIDRLSDPNNPGVNDFVHKTGTETITGEKTFITLPQVTEVVSDRPQITKDNQFIYKGYLEQIINSLKSELTTDLNNNLVHKTGTETITSKKIFSNGCSSNVDPSTSNDLTRKNYVDNELNKIKNTSSPTNNINDFVHKTGTETITGSKKFTGSVEFDPAKNLDDNYPNVVFYRYPKLLIKNDTPSNESIMDKGYIDNLDRVNVKLVGDQSIRGIKTFVDLPKVVEEKSGVYPTISSTDQFIYKGYLDSIVSELNTTISVNNYRAINRENEIVSAIYGSTTVGDRAVLVTGNQNISGTKTFSSVPRCTELKNYITSSNDERDLVTYSLLRSAIESVISGTASDGTYLDKVTTSPQTVVGEVSFSTIPKLTTYNINNYSKLSDVTKLVNLDIGNKSYLTVDSLIDDNGDKVVDYQVINLPKIFHRDIVICDNIYEGESIKAGLFINTLNFGEDPTESLDNIDYKYKGSSINVLGTEVIKFEITDGELEYVDGLSEDEYADYSHMVITNIPEVTGSTNITKNNQLTTKSYVDGLVTDINNRLGQYNELIEVSSYSSLPSTGSVDKIYITKDTNKVYRWSGSGYIEVSGSQVIAASSTNGNILIDGTQTKVYTLPTASSTQSGGVKVGSGLSMTDGTLSVDLSSVNMTTILGAIYPVGSIYLDANNSATCPMQALITNSTWELAATKLLTDGSIAPVGNYLNNTIQMKFNDQVMNVGVETRAGQERNAIFGLGSASSADVEYNLQDLTGLAADLSSVTGLTVNVWKRIS